MQLDFLDLDRGCLMQRNSSTIGLVGLLWHDPAPTDWRERLVAAVARHNQRFGYQANLCHVAPETLNVPPPDAGARWVATINGVEVYANDGVRPNHFFVARRMETQRRTAAPPLQATQLNLLGG
ncbi:MAG: hypothetical protein Kow0031_40980 [Anaerolineae bacterium]